MNLWYILIILIVGLALLGVVSKGARLRRALTERNRALVIAKWQEVERLMDQERTKEAIFEADKLLDFVFRKINLRGETFADRLKAAEKILPNYQDLWAAHKLRNKLAHELDFQPSPREAQRAIDTFDQAIRRLSNL